MQLHTVRQFHAFQETRGRSVFGRAEGNSYHIPRRKRLPDPAVLDHIARRMHFHDPMLDIVLIVRPVEKNLTMWIHPIEVRDGGLRNNGRLVIVGRHPVMRLQGSGER